MDPLEDLIEEIRSMDHQESQTGKLSRKLRDNPFVGIGVVGLIGACAVGAYGFKRRTIPASLYLMQLRVLAQGAVVGSLAGGIAYSVYKTNSEPALCAPVACFRRLDKEE